MVHVVGATEGEETREQASRVHWSSGDLDSDVYVANIFPPGASVPARWGPARKPPGGHAPRVFTCHLAPRRLLSPAATENTRSPLDLVHKGSPSSGREKIPAPPFFIGYVDEHEYMISNLNTYTICFSIIYYISMKDKKRGPLKLYRTPTNRIF
jgi:hypothetical protein